MLSSAIIVALIVAIGFAGLAASLLKSRLLVWDRDRKWGVPRWLKPVAVRLDDLPALVEALSQGSAKVRYAGLVFNTPDRPDRDPVNLNLSFENGTVGFDWVLLAARNLEDQEAFRAFARAQGHEPATLSMNGVSYLRVERGDIARFTASIVTEMYQCPATQPLELVYEGFDWPRS